MSSTDHREMAKLDRVPLPVEAARVGATGWQLTRTGLRVLTKLPTKGSIPDKVIREIPQTFADLGPTYVKFGQIIASSPGAFGEQFADAILDEVERRVAFLCEYLRASGARGFVLGISGGQDSTHRHPFRRGAPRQQRQDAAPAPPQGRLIKAFSPLVGFLFYVWGRNGWEHPYVLGLLCCVLFLLVLYFVLYFVPYFLFLLS